MTQIKLNIVVFHDSIDHSELPTYSTKINDTFIDVLNNVNILPTQWRAYYRWIGNDFEFGHLYKGTTSCLHFVDTWGVNTGKLLKMVPEQSPVSNKHFYQEQVHRTFAAALVRTKNSQWGEVRAGNDFYRNMSQTAPYDRSIS